MSKVIAPPYLYLHNETFHQGTKHGSNPTWIVDWSHAIRTIFEMQQEQQEQQHQQRDNDNNSQHNDNKETEEEWTVISIVSSNTIIEAVTNALKEEQHKRGTTREPVRRHVIWDLPEKSQAGFVSERLAEICDIISA